MAWIKIIDLPFRKLHWYIFAAKYQQQEEISILNKSIQGGQNLHLFNDGFQKGLTMPCSLILLHCLNYQGSFQFLSHFQISFCFLPLICCWARILEAICSFDISHTPVTYNNKCTTSKTNNLVKIDYSIEVKFQFQEIC